MSEIPNYSYSAELKECRSRLDVSFLRGKTLLLSGATGMIGSYLIDTLLIDPDFEVRIIALVRDSAKAEERFSPHKGDQRLELRIADLYAPIMIEAPVDYIIHLASTTSPHEYSAHPIDTMMLNILATRTMLEIAVTKQARFMFVSSTEVYGQSDGNPMNESYSGYLDPLDPRSAYNEGKRAGETLTIAYGSEKGLDVVISRLSRVYGPTLKESDRKALSQFLYAASAHQPIVLKSQGTQRFSYLHVGDAASAILFLLKNGKSREAYNVAGEEVLSLFEIASLVGKLANVEVRIDTGTESGISYSKAQHAVLDISKIKTLGWTPRVNLQSGLSGTLAVLSARHRGYR